MANRRSVIGDDAERLRPTVPVRHESAGLDAPVRFAQPTSSSPSMGRSFAWASRCGLFPPPASIHRISTTMPRFAPSSMPSSSPGHVHRTGITPSSTVCRRRSWEHVAFESGRATLPRTKTGRRVVPLAARVLDLLARLPRINGNPYVFAAGRDEAVTYKTTRRVFAEACERAGLQNTRLHDLRRSVATGLAASGVNAYTLRDVLGHSTLAMSNRYVRTAGDVLAEATERAAALASDAMTGSLR